MEDHTVYLGLGGNLGDPVATFKGVLEDLSKNSLFRGLRCSPFYRTSPVSDLPQNDYLNAVCVLNTSIELEELGEITRGIEVKFGKRPKEKNAPRIIDIDILFFVAQKLSRHSLEVPHPRWKERLFVLQPLSDLTDTLLLNQEDGTVEVFTIQHLLDNFHHCQSQTVTQIKGSEV